MFKLKIVISVIIFSFLLIGTSIIKNQTRELEKNIYKVNKKIFLKEKELYEAQLDFFYLTSPSSIEKKIKNFNYINYSPMKYSKIFENFSNFTLIQNKLTNLENNYEKKSKKK